MHTKVIKILVETLQIEDDVIDPGTLYILLTLFIYHLLRYSLFRLENIILYRNER